jgi:ribosomal protein S18 acetylase RimI-like enzyme
VEHESINLQFQLIRDGKALAVLAEDNEINGFAILIFKEACPSKLSQYSDLSTMAYINDLVVNINYSGKGIGSTLLKKAIELAHKGQCEKVYIERYEENLALAGMM